MTPAEQAAEDARLAITAALFQVAQPVEEALGRLDAEARAGYFELHTTTAKIVQRLAWEVGQGTRQLDATHKAIAGNIAVYEQRRLNALAAPLQSVQQRVGGEILRGIRSIGKANG